MALNRKYDKKVALSDKNPNVTKKDAGNSLPARREEQEKLLDDSVKNEVGDEEENYNLESITQKMLSKLVSAWRDEEIFIIGSSHKANSYLKGIRDIPIEKFEPPEVVIGLLSSVSGGKSSFLNTAVCKYPISPVAKTTTSICAVETRRALSLNEEKIEVCLLSEDKSSLQKKAKRTFSKQILNEKLFNKLFDYAVYLVDQNILRVTDTLSFFSNEEGKIIMRRDNWRHCMVLLMILLNAYVYQDQQNSPSLKSIYKTANEMRNELLTEFKIPIETDYGLRLYWHSDRMPCNAVIVDLPGTGSATLSTNDQVGHTPLVSNYLVNASSVVCFFNETATLDPETVALLDAFIASNQLKGQSSAQLTFVLHKADLVDQASDSQEDSDEAIKTTMNSFYQKFERWAAYPTYALSSYDGELSLLESGISLHNLHQAREYSNNYKRFMKKNPSPDDVMDNQVQRWERAYPFQLDAASDYSKMDYITFTNTLFIDYVRRIQFLLAVDCFKRQVQSVKTIASAIDQEITMFKIAHAYSPKLAEAVSESIQTALEDELNVLIGEFQKLNKDMKSALAQATGRISDIVKVFDKDYSVLNSVINNKLQNTISQLERQNGKIPIDANLIGTNDVGDRNREKVLTLSKTIARINFVSYFNNGFKQLDKEFDTERALYSDSIQEITSLISEFPQKVMHRMNTTFKAALSSKNLQDVDAFHKAFELAKDSTECLLNTVCRNYVNDLLEDSCITDVLENTANKIQEDLMLLLAPYTDGNYGKRVLDRISKFHFFKANTIDESSLKNFLTQYYISDFKDKMDKTLKDDIEGVNEVEKAHTFRMTQALGTLEKNHMSKEATSKLKDQVKNACDVSDKIIGDAQVLEDWKQALCAACKNLRNFFEEGTLFAYFHDMYPQMKSENWARDRLDVAYSESQETKELSFGLRVED